MPDGGAEVRPAREAHDVLRLFVAIELPDPWRSYLRARAADLEHLAPRYFRWVAPELLHLTVVFLGEQPAARLPAVEQAVAASAKGSPSFALALGRLGHFGGRTPRVVWQEARAPAGALDGLYAALTRELTERELTFDAKPLVPHITLGRARRDAAAATGGALARELGQLRAPGPPAPFRVEALALVRSELGPGGPRHTTLGRWPLARQYLPNRPG